jgi:hypothetical protein
LGGAYGYLPKAATRPSWWDEIEADVPPAVQVQAWRSAGYRAQLARDERVVFERA